MGQGDLEMQRRGDHMRDEDEKDPVVPCRDTEIADSVAKPEPEDNLAG